MNVTSATTYWPYNYDTQSTSTTSSTSSISDELLAELQKQLQESTTDKTTNALDSESAASFFSGQMNQGMMPPPPPDDAMKSVAASSTSDSTDTDSQTITALSQQRISQAIQAYEQY